MRAVCAALGEDARHVVFVGSCVLGLYAHDRPEGAPLRTTRNVSCIATGPLPEARVRLVAVEGVPSRYRIEGTAYLVDLVGVVPSLAKAAARAKRYDCGEGVEVRALRPGYLLATKLAAFEERGHDVRSSVDCEDIVTLAVEIEDLAGHVEAERLQEGVAAAWRRVFDRFGFAVADLEDLVDGHLDPREAEHHARVLATLASLAE